MILSVIYNDYETYEFDAPINTSEYFVIRCIDDVFFDNIFVGESLATDTTTTTENTTVTTDNDSLVQTAMLLAGIGCVVIILVALVLVIKNR